MADLNLFFGDHKPAWYLENLKKQPLSKTATSTEFKVFGSDETMNVPLMVSTTVWDVKNLLAMKLGVDPYRLEFVTKQGCSWRTQSDNEECRRKVVVKGIKSFVRDRVKWPEPIAVIGTGHGGLRQAMYFLKMKEFNFVVYDRKAQVGGTSWIDQANVTSKLQTELGTYHLQYDEDNPVPKNMPTWPTRDQLLQHFAEVAEEYGIMPYCKMCTNVKQIIIERGTKQEQMAEMAMTGRPWATSKYKLTLEPTDGTGDGRGDHIGATGEPSTEVTHCAVIFYPGNLTIPRRETYAGEDIFGGSIAYAICNDFDYSEVMHREVALLGHGAFAVENLRTCLEHSAKKVYMVCRRKNLSCPRVASWLINQAVSMLSGPLTMDAMTPAYNLIGFDPWAYHSVHANEKRTNVTINQKARFGIGDVYFIAIAMGVCEVVEDKVKRFSEGALHLESGRKLEVNVVLKLLGFNGNFDVDRLMNIKTMVGWWPDEDFRRFIIAEPIGVNASNFGGTSFSPAIRSWVEHSAHFLWYPADWQIVSGSGMLPRHAAEPEKDRPAYVIDARFGTSTGIMMGTLVMGLAESGNAIAMLKHNKQLECHPTKKFLAECEEEWLEYGRKWKANGAPNDIPPYPYTLPMIEKFLEAEKRELEAAMAKMAARS